ncbi:uncharacterized protein Dmoj_GI26819 [Drosophila mojavensis]|uniref:Uncharacterized protein n=1 Tax=Drosophila mojavensis TaxID=7230 RepID=A0A0Q9X597_DROMO|nr:uncharacterized protein Dmoj_GI26819 [Drosophila mojavensis]
MKSIAHVHVESIAIVNSSGWKFGMRHVTATPAPGGGTSSSSSSTPSSIFDICLCVLSCLARRSSFCWLFSLAEKSI